MTDANFWKAVDETATAASKAGVRTNFGKLGVKPHRYFQWKDGTAVDVTSEVYNTLPPRQRGMEVMFSLDIQEFNPTLEFTYERRVRIGDRDWFRTIVPSVEEVMGKGTMDDGAYASTLRGMVDKYFECQDVPQLNKDGTPSEWNTIKFVKMFASKDECLNAYIERFGAPDATPSTPSAPSGTAEVPPDWTEDAWKNMFPTIKEAIAAGKSPAEVASDFGVAPKFIGQVMSQ